MKIVTLIARVLLGIAFLVFGLNGFLHFIPMGPTPTGLAGQFIGALTESHYFVAISLIQVVSGGLFLANRYVALALTLLAPVLVNIILFHVFMAPEGSLPGIFATVCWLVVAYDLRPAFAGILRQRRPG